MLSFSRYTSFLSMSFSLFAAIGCSDYSLDEKTPFEEEPADTAEEIVEVVPSEYADLQITPDPINFGYVLKDCVAGPMDITLKNIGLETLEITDIYVDGNGAGVFNTTFDGNTITLEPNESRNIGMYFRPSLYLDYEVELKVTSNDPEPPITPVIGIGSEGSLYEEGFSQDYNTAVDVLWVIDNSCSMQDNVQNVKDNFSAFLGSFLSLGLDYQMAIITTDSADNGIFKGPIMRSSQGQGSVQSTFDSTIASILAGAGTSSSQDTEKGLEVTKMALDNSSQASSFIRNANNGLSVILVSDEDDNGSNISGQNFINWFQGKKPNDHTLVRMSAFLSASGGLFGGNPIYDTVIEATQGYVANIDANNWQADLQALALASAGLTVIFPLAQTPATLASITVYVNGQEVPQGIYDGWTYDTRSNSLVFHGSEIPEAGEYVDVSYMIAGTCN